MRFAFVDLKLKGNKPNRDHAGGYGAFMHASGIMGKMIAQLKQNLLDVPIFSFGTSAAILRQAGHPVFYYQGMTQGEEVIIVASSLHGYEEEKEFIQLQRRLFPHSTIGVWGPLVKVFPELFDDHCDFLIQGELETTLKSFLREEHSFKGHLNHGVVQDLNDLPACDWNGFPGHRFNYFPLLPNRPFRPLQSSRGCSFNCDFCPYMVSQTPLYRRKDPFLVVEEMEQLARKENVRSFLFRDICFTLNRNHARSIGREIVRRKFNVEWACETRPDCLDEELIDELYEAGLRGINLGLETGNRNILEGTGKTSPPEEEQRRLIGYLHQKGIRVNAFFMLGLEQDTDTSMGRTIQYAREMNTLGAQFCVMTPFPGTPLFKRLEGRLLTRDFSKFDEYQSVVSLEHVSSGDIDRRMKEAYGHYWRKEWWKRHGWFVCKGILVNLSHLLFSIVHNQVQTLLPKGKGLNHVKNPDHRGQWFYRKKSVPFPLWKRP